MSHRFTTLRVPGTGSYYPAQGKAITSTLVYASGTSGDSDFADGDSDAIIYSMTAQGLVSHNLRVIDASGEDLYISTTGAGNADVFDFGPKGVRMSGGFIMICSTATATILTVVYEKVAKL